jgi:hypothetical protein
MHRHGTEQLLDKGLIMNSRRAFIGKLSVAGSVLATGAAYRSASGDPSDAVLDGRPGWLRTLSTVVEPVLEHLAANRLKLAMPVECAPGQLPNRKQVTHLEAIGRTLAGIAPWLELGTKTGPEAEKALRWIHLAQEGLANATDRTAPDYLDFRAGAQCLVDAAFLAQAFLRAPRALWGAVDKTVQEQLLESFRSTRTIPPGNNNWLLFSALIEAFLAEAGTQWNQEPIAKAVEAHQEWYKGDGAYGDGPEFHWDYYNSYVIQPFLIDVLETIGKHTQKWAALLGPVLIRARRYAAIQERLIGPDGSYPVLGRSIAYRCGAFHLLAQMALRRDLPQVLVPAQVRGALSSVIRRTLQAPETFDKNGWLQIGLAGHQPGLGETYISTGSLYLCTFAFLPLGLPASDPFWTGPDTHWTSRKVWAGQDFAADHALQRTS